MLPAKRRSSILCSTLTGDAQSMSVNAKQDVSQMTTASAHKVSGRLRRCFLEFLFGEACFTSSSVARPQESSESLLFKVSLYPVTWALPFWHAVSLPVTVCPPILAILPARCETACSRYREPALPACIISFSSWQWLEILWASSHCHFDHPLSLRSDRA